MARSGTVRRGRTTSEPLPLQSQIVPPGSRVEEVFGGGAVLTEGVAAGPDGLIYFSDITRTLDCTDERGMQAGHIWRFDPGDGSCRIFRSPSGMANGIVFDRQGRMVVAEGADYGGRRITRTDMATGRSFIVAGQFDGRPFNAPNDVAIDAKQRIYFTDPRYIGWESIEQPVMAVYRIDPDCSVHRVITDVRKPNGVALSPDQRTLYVSSSDNGTIASRRLPANVPLPDGEFKVFSYALSSKGAVGPRRTFADLDAIGQPDGMTVDDQGFVYVAIFAPEPMVAVFSPAGEWVARIDMADATTNVEFGRGKARYDLYITAGHGLYRIRLARAGFHLPPL